MGCAASQATQAKDSSTLVEKGAEPSPPESSNPAPAAVTVTAMPVLNTTGMASTASTLHPVSANELLDMAMTTDSDGTAGSAIRPQKVVSVTTLPKSIIQVDSAHELPDLTYSMRASSPSQMDVSIPPQGYDPAMVGRKPSIATGSAAVRPGESDKLPNMQPGKYALAAPESPHPPIAGFHLPGQEPRILALNRKEPTAVEPSAGMIPLQGQAAPSPGFRGDIPPMLGRGNGGGRSQRGRGGRGFPPTVAPIAAPGYGRGMAPATVFAPAMAPVLASAMGGRGTPVMGRGRGRALQVVIPGNGRMPQEHRPSIAGAMGTPAGANPVVKSQRQSNGDQDNDDDKGDDDDDDDVDGDDVGEWDLGDGNTTEDTADDPFGDFGGDDHEHSKSVHTAATPSSSPTKASKSDSPTKSTKPGVSKFQPQLETDDFEVVDTSRNSGNGDDDDDDDDGAGGDEEMVDDWLDPEASPSVAVSCDSSSPKKTLSGNANVAPVATAHTPLAPRNMAAPKPFHSAPINDVATSYHNAPPPALRQPSVLAVGGMNGGLSPTRQLAPVQSPIPTNHSPTKPGSYRASIVATNGMPVVLPIVDPNAAGIRDTKVVKKKKAELPQGNLPHPQPKFGDWLNSRTMINNYIILESLGAGSYAEVKLCKEKMSGKLYAMKFINRDIMKKDKLGKQSKLDDIKREIAIMKKLHHPNVLRLYEVMDDPKMNKLFLVLEYMKHGDLLGHQRKKYEKLHGSAQANASATQLNDRDIHCVTLQILLGLAYLHEQKIVHGDIKPQNLLVGDNDVVKIADFGISQTLYGSKQKLTDSTGTPAFMSPEMCSGEEYSGQMADIWAVGATVFMLKFGNPPFVAKSAMQMFEKIQKDPLVFPAAIDPMFEDLLRGMLTKDPQRRMTLLQVMTHPWVTKDEHHSNFSIRQPAPQITVSKDDIDHAIDADRFKIIVDIRIQMMKRLHHAREEVVKAHNARESQLKHALLHDQGPSSPRAGEQSSPLSAIAHRTNKIHISTEDEPQPVRSNDEVEEDRKMLSSEEIHYRAQMFSRKKPSAATSACSSPSNASVMAKKDAVHTSGDQDHDSAAASDLGDVEEDCLSSDEEDGNAVAQSPQLLDELLLTTLSMPPLSTSHSEGYLASGNWSAVHHAHASSTLSLLDAPSFFAESPSLSMSFAVTSLEGRRNTQEDRWVVLPSLQETAAASGSETADIWAHSAFVGLYDGHGGEECANILQEQLHSWLFRMPDDYFAHPEKLEKCFLELDSFVCDYLLHKGDLSGSTATCMIFSPAKTPGKVLVTVGHVGDCRLVLCRRNGENVDITNDHRLTHADERQRILALGGRVVNNRVNGVMAITRAFGDLEFKGMIGRMKPGSFISAPSSPGPPQFNPFQLEEEKIPALLTARPDISMLELDAKTDEFLVLACDGLWDVMTSEEAREIIRDRFHLHRDLQLVAKELAQEAIRRYSNDNITVVLMRLVDGAIDAPTTVIHAE